MPRPPNGERALTGAERRAAHFRRHRERGGRELRLTLTAAGVAALDRLTNGVERVQSRMVEWALLEAAARADADVPTDGAAREALAKLAAAYCSLARSYESGNPEMNAPEYVAALALLGGGS